MGIEPGSWRRKTRGLWQQPKAGFCHGLLITFFTGQAGCVSFPCGYESSCILSLPLLTTSSSPTTVACSQCSRCEDLASALWGLHLYCPVMSLSFTPPPLHGSRKIGWWAIWVKIQWECCWEGWRAVISFTLIPFLPLGPKYSPLLYKRERESRSVWCCQGIFLFPNNLIAAS